MLSSFMFRSANLVSVLIAATMSAASNEHTFMPANGYVPDERVALAIAEAVLIPIYGAEQIRSQRPFRAVLKDGVWTVTGSLPRGAVGGTALIEISKKDGCIRRVIHGL